MLAGPSTPGREEAAKKLQKRCAGYQGPGLCQGQESSWRGEGNSGKLLVEVCLKSCHARFKCGLSSDTQENWLCDTKVAQAVTHDSPVTF